VPGRDQGDDVDTCRRPSAVDCDACRNDIGRSSPTHRLRGSGLFSQIAARGLSLRPRDAAKNSQGESISSWVGNFRRRPLNHRFDMMEVPGLFCFRMLTRICLRDQAALFLHINRLCSFQSAPHLRESSPDPESGRRRRRDRLMLPRVIVAADAAEANRTCKLVS